MACSVAVMTYLRAVSFMSPKSLLRVCCVFQGGPPLLMFLHSPGLWDSGLYPCPCLCPYPCPCFCPCNCRCHPLCLHQRHSSSGTSYLGYYWQVYHSFSIPLGTSHFHLWGGASWLWAWAGSTRAVCVQLHAVVADWQAFTSMSSCKNAAAGSFPCELTPMYGLQLKNFSELVTQSIMPL